MSHNIPWRGLVAAAALSLTVLPAFCQGPSAVIDIYKTAEPEDNLIVFDSAVLTPAIPMFTAVGEFGSPAGNFVAAQGCPMPPGGRPPFSQMPPGGPFFGAHFTMPLPPPFPLPDLSDDQITRMAKLKRTFESGNSSAFSTLKSLTDEMQNKLSADNINESEVRRLAEEIAQQKADMSKRLSAHILEMAKILTPEQRKKIKLERDRMELGPMGGFPKMRSAMPPPPPAK